MTGAVILGLLLIMGGGLVDGLSMEDRDGVDEERLADVPLYRQFMAKRQFTRTGVLLQALGTVLLIMGLLAYLL